MLGRIVRSLAVLAAVLPALVMGGDDDWESPVYKNFYSVPLKIPAPAIPKTSYTNETTGTTIDYYEINIIPFNVTVYPGLPGVAQLVGYDGSSPGPTIHATRGRETVIRFINNSKYDRPVGVHLHGSYSRAPFDGWAEDIIPPGFYKDYYYPNDQTSRTMWYHDHTVHITASNAYKGLMGFYLLRDPDQEASMGLPMGIYDVPLGLSSKQYNSRGELVSIDNERESMYGDVFHVNGDPWPFFEVEARKYRFRVLNAAVSRSFRLTLTVENSNNPIPFHVVAADAGYLRNPVQTTELYIAMAERYDIVVDFAPYKGKRLILKNARDVFKDEDYGGTNRVMQFRVKNANPPDLTNNGPLRTTYPSIPPPPIPPSSQGIRTFKFEKSNGEWLINGVAFADVKNRILAKPPRGRAEIWELENSSGGWSHPIHIHLVDFQILSRTGGRGKVMPYEAAGLKDVSVLGPNEKVRLVAKYAPWDGVYMFHCHNLIHEDHDMMAAFDVSEETLRGFGYGETTKFVNPMEERWRAKRVGDGAVSLQQVQTELLPMFSGLDAYHSREKAEKALDKYWGYSRKRAYPPALPGRG